MGFNSGFKGLIQEVSLQTLAGRSWQPFCFYCVDWRRQSTDRKRKHYGRRLLKTEPNYSVPKEEQTATPCPGLTFHQTAARELITMQISIMTAFLYRTKV